MARREIDIDVGVERTGDQDALRKTADEIKDVDRAADQASGGGLPKFGKQIQSTGGHAGDASKRLQDLTRVSKSASGSVGGLGSAASKAGKGIAAAGKAIAGAGAALLVFKESFDRTREVVNFFEREFGISIDNMVAKIVNFDAIAEVFTRTGNTVEQNAELLRNQANIFNNLNIDGFSSNVEKNAELISQHMRAIADANAEVQAEIEAGQAFLQRFSLSQDELLAKAESFAAGLSSALSFEGVDLEVLRERVSGPLLKLLEDLRASGAQIPAELQSLADKLGVTRDNLQEIGPAAKQASDGLRELASADFKKTTEGLRGVREELERVNIAALPIPNWVMALQDPSLANRYNSSPSQSGQARYSGGSATSSVQGGGIL